MSSQPTGERARVIARQLPIDLGGVKARVPVADIDIASEPGKPLDLDNPKPQIRIHAAQVVVAGSEIDRVAHDGAKGAGLDLHVSLQAPDRFEASGTGPGKVPFKAGGKVKAVFGKLAFLPQGIDLTAGPAKVHVDIETRKAIARVPSTLLTDGLRGAAGSAAPPANWPLKDPKVSWTAPGVFRLETGLALDGSVAPLSLTGTMGASDDNQLRIGLSNVNLVVQGIPVAVDLPSKTAIAKVSAGIVQASVARGPLENAVFDWSTPSDLALQGDLALSDVIGGVKDSAGERVHVSLNAKMGAVGGDLEARLKRVRLAGRGFDLDARLDAGRAIVHVAANRLDEELKKATKGKVEIKGLSWPAADSWKIEALVSGTPLTATGTLATTAEGHLAFRVDSLEAQQGADMLALSIDPAANRINATVPEKVVTRMIASTTPLQGLDLSIKKGGNLQARGAFPLLGMSLPMRLDGKLRLGNDGAVRYAVDDVRMLGIRINPVMNLLGLTLQTFDKKGPWEGNTLSFKPESVPPGMRLAAFETADGALEVALEPDGGLPNQSKGIRFDGRTLDVDVAALGAVPGTIRAAHADAKGLTVDLALDPRKLQKLAKLPDGVRFDGTNVRASLAALVGKPVPAKLSGLRGGKDGLSLDLALDSSVLAPLANLPGGMKFDGSGVRLDPKQGADVPGKLIAATGWAGELQLTFGLSEADVKNAFKPDQSGLAWDGHALTVDPTIGAPGARATGAVIKDGDLVVEVGDGTPLPVPSAERVVRLDHPGRARIQGFLVDHPVAEIRPKAGVPWSLDKMAAADIKFISGKVVVPPAKLEELLKAKLGADYAKFRPEFDGRRLIVRIPMPIGSIPLALRFERSSDGKLALEPSGFWGQIPLLEWPQRLIGMLLSPVTWLIPAGDEMKVDLAAASGMNLPPLTDAEATPEGLVLDFRPKTPSP